MTSIEAYSMGVFLVIFVSGCAINLLNRHYIIQLAGIAFSLICLIFRIGDYIKSNPGLTLKGLYIVSLPVISGISACIISMVAGFWIFPPIRRKFKA